MSQTRSRMEREKCGGYESVNVYERREKKKQKKKRRRKMTRRKKNGEKK